MAWPSDVAMGVQVNSVGIHGNVSEELTKEESRLEMLDGSSGSSDHPNFS